MDVSTIRPVMISTFVGQFIVPEIIERGDIIDILRSFYANEWELKNDLCSAWSLNASMPPYCTLRHCYIMPPIV